VHTTLDGTGNAERDDLIEKAAAFAVGRKGTGGPPGDTSADLLRYFYRHVAAEDIAQRTEMDLYGAALSQYKAASYRPQGTANIRVFTPTVSEHGWSADGHTVVEVVTDDMPFLVDSVTMELNEQNREVHMVVHPQILVRRDVAGHLQEILPGDETQVDRGELPHDISRESWMHIEIGRESSSEQREEIERALGKVLQDVREAVEDWP
jgi:glutamate dehydrogenase